MYVVGMIVDVHAHYHPRAYHEALARMPGFGGGSGFAAGTQPVTDDEPHIQTRLEMMDAAGVCQITVPRRVEEPNCTVGLPALLSNYSDELLRSYWEVERPSFMKRCAPADLAGYEALWDELAELVQGVSAERHS